MGVVVARGGHVERRVALKQPARLVQFACTHDSRWLLSGLPRITPTRAGRAKQ